MNVARPSRVVEEHAPVVGIDLGGTKIRSVVVREDGTMFAEDVDLIPRDSFSNMLKRLKPNPAKFPAGCKFQPRCHRTRQLAVGVPVN